MLIATLLGIGIVLILIEVLFVPGTTIVGIAGGLCAAIGIYLTYRAHGPLWGTGVLLGAALVAGVAFYYGFRSESWQRFALQDRLLGRTNDQSERLLKPGEVGETLSALRPYGKAEFPAGTFEVFSQDGFVPESSKVRILRIDNNRVTVETIKPT
ncbi:NfeD-like C-terminal, partner-binding [Catalinimonas alkaloidigena]|uniref:NfeD-like C-terminal, partner-binding n=1 Tax=Catalinimonas alkaloidigena TaxID=1075417 RepID=A0A1G9ECT9_9BACT|nr:NfeD family protein [Catalinimonas alkaloidigena]SDK73992.1 NfeD-like C-terminal, partner-binding [Catalinimonas alkaloidigena]